MPRPIASRKFGIVDLMTLVAATAVGLAATRGLLRVVSGDLDLDAIFQDVTDPSSWTLAEVVGSAVEYGTSLVIPTFAAWTVALSIILFRKRRGPRRRWSRRPGWMAPLVASMAMAIALVAGAMIWWAWADDPADLAYWALLFASIANGMAVAWCWATMAISGRFRPEPTWADRLGRLVGLGWIAIGAFDLYGILYLRV